MMGTFAFLLLVAAPPADGLKSDLLSEDADKAIQAAAKLGTEKKAEPLFEALSLGTSPKVTAAILDALAQCKAADTTEVFLRYSDHRNAEVRKRALAALEGSADKRVSPRFFEALGDADPGVRSLAAKTVAKRKEKGAEDALLKLLERGDVAASAPLGQIAGPPMTRRLCELQGSLSDVNLSRTLGEILRRNEVADPIRLEVVKTLGKIPGSDALGALSDYVASIPEKQERPSKTEAQKILEQKGPKKP